MNFCTVITCMDGRIQLPVNKYLSEYYNAPYVDTITEAGPIKTLTEQKDIEVLESIYERIEISLKAHKSVGMAVVGHFDCARNPLSAEKQIPQIKESIEFLKKRYSDVEIIGLWVDQNWEVVKV